MTSLLVALLLFVSDLERAERAYRMGDFQKAMEFYEAALEVGEAPNGALLYNMGNCAMRLGDPALATLCYRRALLWLPGNSDVLANLRLADEQLGLDQAGPPPSRGSPWLWLAAVVALQGIGLALVVMRRARGVRLLGVLLVGAGLAVAADLLRQEWLPGLPAGVVLTDQVQVLEEPREQAGSVCVLPAGAVVEVIETSPEWLRVQHAKGEGWARRGPVAVVE